MDRLANTKEVAEYLGIAPNTLSNWAYQGLGPVYSKINGQRRYDWADVRAWVEARKVNQ